MRKEILGMIKIDYIQCLETLKKQLNAIKEQDR